MQSYIIIAITLINMEGEHRKRLKKLKSETVKTFLNDLIPKKKNIPISEKIVKTMHDDSDDSLEEFISDRIEYDKNGPPISSEESAHSTDEENVIKKKKKVKESSSEKSAESSVSQEAPESEDFLVNNEDQGEAPEILVGKKALEAKRQQGLVPDIKKTKEPKEEKKIKKKKKHEEDPKPKEKSKKHKDPKKYVQFSEFDEKDRKKAEMVTKILQR